MISGISRQVNILTGNAKFNKPKFLNKNRLPAATKSIDQKKTEFLLFEFIICLFYASKLY